MTPRIITSRIWFAISRAKNGNCATIQTNVSVHRKSLWIRHDDSFLYVLFNLAQLFLLRTANCLPLKTKPTDIYDCVKTCSKIPWTPIWLWWRCQCPGRTLSRHHSTWRGLRASLADCRRYCSCVATKPASWHSIRSFISNQPILPLSPHANRANCLFIRYH